MDETGAIGEPEQCGMPQGAGRRWRAVEVFHSTDPDEATARAATHFYPTTIDLVTPGFAVDMHVVDLGMMAGFLLQCGNETGYTVLEREDAYHVDVGLDGGIDSTIGHEQLAVDPTTAVVTGPAMLARVHGWSAGGERLLGIKFVRVALETQLRSMIGRDVTDQIRFDPRMRLDRGVGPQWLRLARAFADEASEHLSGHGPLGWHPLLAARTCDAVMAGLLLGCESQFSELLWRDERAAMPAAVRRAVEIMQERAHESLTISGVAAEIGLSVRALQSGFRQVLGVTPGSYLTDVRLERAHRSLAEAARGAVSATAVAAAWGFGNYGRFARKYKQRYGESPAETLESHGG